MTVYPGGKVYGPYQRKEDNRSHVIIIFPNGDRLTVSYPKYLMEVHLERYLSDTEEVHHKDEDVTNNVIDNFEIIFLSEHRHLHSKTPLTDVWICAYCGLPFQVTRKQIHTRNINIKRGRANSGPFCSSSCRGKVNH